MENLGRLRQQLKSKIANEKKQTELLMQQELQKLKQSLTLNAKNVLHTINKDMDQEAKKIRRSLTLVWIQPILVGLCLLSTICLGSWGITQYLSQKITNQLHQIQQAQSTLSSLNTWGIVTSINDKGRFIILPENSAIETNWKIQNKPAIKISTN